MLEYGQSAEVQDAEHGGLFLERSAQGLPVCRAEKAARHDKAETPPFAEQRNALLHEVGKEICHSVVGLVVLSKIVLEDGQGLLPHIGRIADDCIEPTGLHDLRELGLPVERIDKAHLLLVRHELTREVVRTDEAIPALDVLAKVWQRALMHEGELPFERLIALSFQDFQQQTELGDFYGLTVNIHTVDIVHENPLLLLRGQPPFAAGRVKEFLAVLLRPIRHIPITMIVQQIPVGADQKRSRPAGRIEDSELGDLLRRLALAQRADCVSDDVLDDVGGRVIDAAGFLDLRLLFDLGLMAGGEPDDFAKELLVDLA